MADLPGTPFDVSDLKACSFCRQGVMHRGDVVFYEIGLSQCVVDVKNVQRMHGLEQMVGGAVGLARVFSPDNTIARRLPATRHLVCQPCLLEHEGLAMLIEQSDD
jgi:hypothetical protein